MEVRKALSGNLPARGTLSLLSSCPLSADRFCALASDNRVRLRGTVGRKRGGPTCVAHRSCRPGKNTPANESTGRGVVAAKHDVD